MPVDLPEVDITDRAGVDRLVRALAAEPAGLDAIVNCAAWTDVDGAESKREQARAVNAPARAYSLDRPQRLTCRWCTSPPTTCSTAPRRWTATASPRPYVESDPTGPRSVYGRRKLEGEDEVSAASPRHVIARTAWLYGVDGPNFVETMLRLAGERDEVQVVTDQIGSPTWAGHLAPALLGLIERGVSGLVHLTGGGEVSWNGFAREIFRQADVRCEVAGASSEQMARPAPRPAWSALQSERDDVLPMPDWRDGLAGYLAARAGMMRA